MTGREGPAVNEANPAGVWDRQTICNERTRSPRSARLLPEIPLCPVHMLTGQKCDQACEPNRSALLLLIADLDLYWWTVARREMVA